MPRVGSDLSVINKIKLVLKSNPQGLWIREIARKARLPKSTVHFYINNYMKNEVEDVIKVKGNLIRLVRLKK